MNRDLRVAAGYLLSMPWHEMMTLADGVKAHLGSSMDTHKIAGALVAAAKGVKAEASRRRKAGER